MSFSYPLFEIPFVGIYLIVLAFMFGAVFASFITCAAWRVVRNEDWIRGHSHCDTCGHELSTADLFTDPGMAERTRPGCPVRCP